jgi:UDP-N-acetylglucosamine 2-epimerase
MTMKVLLVLGTRPEAIKMLPVAEALSGEVALDVKICVTGQHRQMLDQVFDVFEIRPDFDLDIMTHAQGLEQITSSVLRGLGPALDAFRPDRVLVHGDTTTTMAASLAAFYKKISVGHVEAGLRSGDLGQPWPEEMNRRVTDVIADQLFAPTRRSRDNLLRENVNAAAIHVTGNTGIDHRSSQRIPHWSLALLPFWRSPCFGRAAYRNRASSLLGIVHGTGSGVTHGRCTPSTSSVSS